MGSTLPLSGLRTEMTAVSLLFNISVNVHPCPFLLPPCFRRMFFSWCKMLQFLSHSTRSPGTAVTWVSELRPVPEISPACPFDRRVTRPSLSDSPGVWGVLAALGLLWRQLSSIQVLHICFKNTLLSLTLHFTSSIKLET